MRTSVLNVVASRVLAMHEKHFYEFLFHFVLKVNKTFLRPNEKWGNYVGFTLLELRTILIYEQALIHA
jgi:hypothetical protein